MNTNKQKNQNNIALYRQRMQVSQTQVARLLGQRRAGTLSSYETGRKLPPLPVALRLSIILRVPVEFLFPQLYETLRQQIRSEEEALSGERRQISERIAS